MIENNQPSYVCGIDISKKAIEHIRSKKIKGEVIDICKKEFEAFLKKNNFDYIIITEVIEHIQSPEDVLLLIKKYQSDAAIFVSIPNSGFILHRLRFLFGKFPVIVIVEHIKEHIRFWTHSDFKFWIDYLGFRMDSFFVSSTTRILGFDFGKLIPSLFGKQIIYKLEVKR